MPFFCFDFSLSSVHNTSHGNGEPSDSRINTPSWPKTISFAGACLRAWCDYLMGDTLEYLTIKNWEEFQHYKTRNPPWIKLHFEILMSHDWVMLADASKLLAVVSMLIASRNEGRIPLDPEYVQRVGHLSTLPDFKPLIDVGFFKPCKHLLADASTKVQANAIIETEAYNTTETETPSVEQARPSGVIERIFSYWQEQRGHPKSSLDGKRRKAIAARLKENYTEERIKEAIRGIANSPHNMGQNERNTVYDDIELICRSGANVDRFADMGTKKIGQVVNVGRYERALGGQNVQGRLAEGDGVVAGDVPRLVAGQRDDGGVV